MIRSLSLALLLATGCASPARTPVPPLPTADRPLGHFVDDYGEEYEISVVTWLQQPHGLLHIRSWSASGSFLIAQNDPANQYDPGKWTRIDWIRLDGMAPWEWAFCLSAYDAPTADSAEATHIAHPDTPRTGCNGHPFTRLQTKKPPLP